MAQRREKHLRVAFRIVVIASAAIGLAAAFACNKAEFTDNRTPGCQDPKVCTCEEDPTQATCKGYNERPEFESGLGDVREIPEDSGTSNDDADTDALDASDASDGAD